MYLCKILYLIVKLNLCKCKFCPHKENGDKGTRCERMLFMDYPVRVTVQNKPVNLDNAPHFTIYISPILDDEVGPYWRI